MLVPLSRALCDLQSRPLFDPELIASRERLCTKDLGELEPVIALLKLELALQAAG
jgi:hypothetical protein